VHGGRVQAHSDGQGASFIPFAAFASGETVTVRTAMNIAGANGGTYHFTVAMPAVLNLSGQRLTATRVRGDVEHFRSRPDLAPAAIRIFRNSRRAARGDLFLGAQSSPVQDGPEIRDSRGRLIWYEPVPANDYVSDFRTQKLLGVPVLTWWQGFVRQGVGVGEEVIADNKYHALAVLSGGNGIHPDLHEFRISRRGTALMTAFNPIWWNERSVGGPARAIVRDAVVQEIDIATGLVMYQWDALDHIPLSASYKPRFKNIHHPWDFFHVNSVQDLGDGNLFVSARNTWAAYKLDHRTGKVLWTLGGKRSSFKMGRGAGFAFQHDAELQPHNVVSMFDDGAGPPIIHKQSRVLGLRLNFARKTASVAFSFTHTPLILSYFEGGTQRLPNGDYFAGWGSDPHFTEFSRGGQLVFDARFVADSFHDRAYRLRWSATPDTSPSVAASRRGRRTTVYASWNGATGVRSWRVLAGPSPTSLRSVRSARWRGFETAISISAASWVAVVALDGHGHPISAPSAAVRG